MSFYDNDTDMLVRERKLTVFTFLQVIPISNLKCARKRKANNKKQSIFSAKFSQQKLLKRVLFKIVKLAFTNHNKIIKINLINRLHKGFVHWHEFALSLKKGVIIIGNLLQKLLFYQQSLDHECHYSAPIICIINNMSILYSKVCDFASSKMVNIKPLKSISSHLEYVSKHPHGVPSLYSIKLLRNIIQHLNHSLTCQLSNAAHGLNIQSQAKRKIIIR